VRHYWRVRAKDAATNLSPWSVTETFLVDTGLPATPVATAVSPDPTASASVLLAWSAVSDAVVYDVQVSADTGDFEPLAAQGG